MGHPLVKTPPDLGSPRPASCSEEDFLVGPLFKSFGNGFSAHGPANCGSRLESRRTRKTTLQGIEIRVIGNQTTVLVPADPRKRLGIDDFRLCELL